MLIKNLPPKLRNLANRRTKEHRKNSANKFIDAELFLAFEWSETKEGKEFWETLENSGKPYLPRLLKIWDWTKASEVDLIHFDEITGYLDTQITMKEQST